MSASHPAPVSMSTISSIIVALCASFGAISKMLAASPEYYEEAMANWCSTSMAPGITGNNDRGQFTFLGEASHFGAGCGARSYKDGVDTGGIIINTTASMPSIEETESEYPVMYLFRRQLIDSGGPGQFRGGLSAGLALMPYDATGPIESTFSSCGVEIPNSYGLAGGLPGSGVRYIRFVGTGIRDRIAAGAPLPSDVEAIDGERIPTFTARSHAQFPVDSVEYHNWQGGGGYGDPLERDPLLVLDDVTSKRVSPVAAHKIYGVVLTDGAVNERATTEHRVKIRQERLAAARPAREILPPASNLAAMAWVDQATMKGTVRYGQAVEFDFTVGISRCVACRCELTPAHTDFREGCAVQMTPITAAGPARGEDYDRGRVQLYHYLCPECGRRLEAEVVVDHMPGSGFRLA